MAEIAETIVLPPGLAGRWSVRGYYGTVNHNVKAVYQRYLSWYDGNPCNLHPLPPAPAARKFVEYMGGAPAVIARARADFAKGEFRWVAQVMKEVVFAEPANKEARDLCADALEQIVTDGLRHLYLGHLSKECNRTIIVDALMNEVRDRKTDLRITVVDPLEDNPVSLW